MKAEVRKGKIICSRTCNEKSGFGQWDVLRVQGQKQLAWEIGKVYKVVRVPLLEGRWVLSSLPSCLLAHAVQGIR